MPNVHLLNQSLQSVCHSFSMYWKLTRALKKAGWRTVASSNGTTKDTYANPDLANPANDKWNGTGSAVGNSGAAATLSSKTLDDITVTGLTSMTSLSVGRYLTITGAATSANNGTYQIVEFLSSNSVKIRNAAGSSGDGNNGSISWSELDYTLETYPSALDSVACWWVGQGPTTLKIPIPASTTGTFVRGEKITQATSLAEGELLGVVLDTGSTSFLVVMPCIGTFDTSNIITGALSTATVTPTGSAISTYVEEVVFAKSTDIFNGWAYWQRVDSTTESTQRFSYLANTAAGCTATVAPGNGGTGNSFPSIAAIIRGTAAGSATSLAPGVTTTSGNLANGKFHVVATNVIGLSGQTPDGTFWILHTVPGTSSLSYGGLVHMRMDDTEEGDVDPFIVGQGSTGTGTRTAQTGTTLDWISGGQIINNSNGWFNGWRARGISAYEGWQSFNPAVLYPYNGSFPLVCTNGLDPERSYSHPGKPFVRDPIWYINTTAFSKVRKGSARWLNTVPTGSPGDLWNNKSYIQISSGNVTQVPAVILGPWDGSTDPIYV